MVGQSSQPSRVPGNGGPNIRRKFCLALGFGGVFWGGLTIGLLLGQELVATVAKVFAFSAEVQDPTFWETIFPQREASSVDQRQPVAYQDSSATEQHSSAVRPSSRGHVPELARYLDQVQIAHPVFYRQLAVYPLLLQQEVRLEGRWLTLDEAMRRGVLVVTEKDGGTVPVIVVENRSQEEYVFIMTGEILSGGKQTRTVRQDVVLAPGQRVDLGVFCVERGRWEGGEKFLPSARMAPMSVQKQIYQGGGQHGVWAAVGGVVAQLRASTPSENLAIALDAPHVRRDLDKVHKEILPRIPDRTMGFLFLQGRRPVGANMFGDARIARELLPKLLDAYGVDCLLLEKDLPIADQAGSDREAIEFFKRIVRAGSHRSKTPGSGAGIQTEALGLVGGGVSFGGTVVHYGVYVRHEPIIPLPLPKRLEGFRPESLPREPLQEE